ncbi:unnamed protein product [Rhizophagus irregularis]|uniref:protein-tyrosine-phosphatase n=1 Tax=Rhizophagus irregularis TaxID=588596 RepID=A0A2I1GFA5_9GLOM|nr:phosphatases II [Rhizophagus irregularis]CAB4402888.1 unnamed protein product [Rhizophagus irregularis]
MSNPVRTITAENIENETAHTYYIEYEKKLSKLASRLAHGAENPAEIVMDFLYISDAATGANSDLLARYKITHIINVSPCVNFFEKNVPQKYPNWDPPKYLRLNTSEINIAEFFDVSNLFIYQAAQEGGRVLIYCWTGASESATLMLAYLMNHYWLTYQDAFNYLNGKSIIDPHSTYRLQLINYELELLRAWKFPVDDDDDISERDELKFEDYINYDDESEEITK